MGGVGVSVALQLLGEVVGHGGVKKSTSSFVVMLYHLSYELRWNNWGVSLSLARTKQASGVAAV